MKRVIHKRTWPLILAILSLVTALASLHLFLGIPLKNYLFISLSIFCFITIYFIIRVRRTALPLTLVSFILLISYYTYLVDLNRIEFFKILFLSFSGVLIFKFLRREFFKSYYIFSDRLKSSIESPIVTIKDQPFSIMDCDESGIVLKGVRKHQRRTVVDFSFSDKSFNSNGVLVSSLGDVFTLKLTGKNWREVSKRLERLGYNQISKDWK